MEKQHSDIESVRILVSLLVQKGIRNTVLSPGSRNAPLLISIAREERLTRHIIVDERSAAFFALGIAQQTGEPVALTCTSGTALLNYAPAVAEAYYQGIPLIVISADRPTEWIDQDDSQTIRQQNVLDHFVKKSYQLPTTITCEEEHWHTNRIINEAINLSRDARQGPVHLNVPLREPLYGFHHAPQDKERLVEVAPTNPVLPDTTVQELRNTLASCPKVMIIAGQNAPDTTLQARVEQLAQRPNVVTLTESVANLTTPHALSTIDRVLSTLSTEEEPDFAPDLLISFGGSIISRAIKAFIRTHPPHAHWHIDERIPAPDTYRSLTLHIPMSAREFFRQLDNRALSPNPPASGYATRWAQKNQYATRKHDAYLQHVPWCDLKAFSILIPSLPADSHLQLGNSTPIRYAQLFRHDQVARSDANRGTSGIDGCTSTAVGASVTFNGITTLIVGDNSFLYDSNALWIKNISPSLRIIVIQNGGGGIFRFLPGPSVLDEVEEYFETPHQINLCKLAEVHHFHVLHATDESSLNQLLPLFYEPSERPSILVIETPGPQNGQILKDYFKTLQKTETT